MARQISTGEKNLYAIHTYSGYEDSVARNLKQRIESFGMEDKIFNGYVLVEMIVTDDSWYVVRNTPSVTGFIGASTIPSPLAKEEVESILKRMGVEEPKYKFDIVAGDNVKITDGPFKDFDGRVAEGDRERGRLKGLETMFG